MLKYQLTDILEFVGFRDSNYASYVDDNKSTSGYIYMMAKGAMMSAQKHSLQTRDLARFEINSIYI